MRDFDKDPYTEAEEQVCRYLTSLSDDIGCGDDPVGFLIASHQALVVKNKSFHKPTPAQPD